MFNAIEEWPQSKRNVAVCLAGRAPLRAFRLLQPFVQFVGELLTVPLVERVRATGLDAAGAQGCR